MKLTYSACEPTGTIILFDEGKIVADLSISGRVESGPLDFDVQVKRAKLLCAAEDMARVLEAYELWEGRVLLSDEAWGGAELPTITQELWDELMELQEDRNNALHQAERGARFTGARL